MSELRTITVTCPVVDCGTAIELPIVSSWPDKPHERYDSSTLVITLTADQAPLSEHLITHSIRDVTW